MTKIYQNYMTKPITFTHNFERNNHFKLIYFHVRLSIDYLLQYFKICNTCRYNPRK